LAQHHRDKREIWLILYKKSTRTQRISYEAAVEEAVCYGWIDGQTKRVDDETYALRFTPRRKNSNWSESNKVRALKMLRAGRITRSGKAVLPATLLERKET